MKQYQATFHFRNANGEIVGVYLFDTVKQFGLPVKTEAFRQFVRDSKVMFLEEECGELEYRLSQEEQNLLKNIPGFFVSASEYSKSMQAYWNSDAWTDELMFDLFKYGALPVTILPVMRVSGVGEMICLEVSGNTEKLEKLETQLKYMGVSCQLTNVCWQGSMMISMRQDDFEHKQGLLREELKGCIFCFPPLGKSICGLREHFNSRWLHGVEVIAGVPNSVLRMFVKMNNELWAARKKHRLDTECKTAVMSMF